jgi:hypothetical protein
MEVTGDGKCIELFSFCTGNLEERDHSGEQHVDYRIILSMNLREQGVRVGLDTAGFRVDSIGGCTWT